MNLEKNREVMIENQLRPNKITNNDVLQAFMNTSKEQFISEDKINICYSDQDIFIKDQRGYLKNLHLAQILHFADIKNILSMFTTHVRQLSVTIPFFKVSFSNLSCRVLVDITGISYKQVSCLSKRSAWTRHVQSLLENFFLN